MLTEAAVPLPAKPADIVFQDDGELSVLSNSYPDFVEVRHLDPALNTIWVAEPRSGFSIEASLLEWDPRSDRLLMRGGNRPDGGAMVGWSVVLDPDGNIEWERTAGDTSGGQDIVADPLGGFVVAEWRAELRLQQFLPTACD